MENLDLGKNNLRKFGITMAIAILVIAILSLWLRHKNILFQAFYVCAIFLSLAIFLPAILKPLYIIWMKFASILGWINTRLIVFILFFLIFTPLGFAIKLLRKDLLKIKLDGARPTYWNKKELKPSQAQDYERQF